MKIFGFNITKEDVVVQPLTEVQPLNVEFSQQEIPLIEKIDANVTVVNSFSFASDNKYLPSDYTHYAAGGYMRYGADNLFPNKLIELYNSSPLHKSAVDFKVRLLFGEGYEFKTQNSKIKDEVFAENISEGKYNLKQLILNTIIDFKLLGNYYLLYTWNSDFTRIVSVERLKAFNVRLKVSIEGEITGVMYCNDWKHKPGTTKNYPLFSKKNKTDKKQVYIGINETIDNSVYSYPDYVSGLNSIAANAAIGLYQLNIIENGFSPSMSIHFFKKPQSPEEKNKIVSGIQSQYAGKKNAGKALIFFSDGKELAPEVKPIDVSNLDKQYTVLEQSIENSIVYAHSIISPTLLGIKTGGQLGNTQELKNAFIISNKMKSELERPIIEEGFNTALKINGLDEIALKNLEIFPEETLKLN